MASITSATNAYRHMSTSRLMKTMNAQMNLARSGRPNRIGTSGASPKLGSALSKESLSFVSKYQSSMSSLRDAANELRNFDNAQELVASSSNTDVATAKALWGAGSGSGGSYDLEVTQLATEQINRSTAVNADGTDFSGELNLVTAEGTVAFKVDASATNNADAMRDMAKQINASKLGVSASVTVKDGKSSLELSSTTTGTNSAFAVTGSFATSAGLSAPTQQAQNAVYTVRNSNSTSAPEEFTSQSNNVYVAGKYQIQAQLKTTGSTKVTLAADPSKTAKAISGMVDAYNSALKLLNGNAERGKGVLTQMSRMLKAGGNDEAMKLIGIKSAKDGSLSFDEAAFKKIANEQPEFIRNIVSGSSSLANHLYTAAQQGMRQSSRSLLSEDMNTAALGVAYGTNGATGSKQQSYSGAFLDMLA